MPDIVSVIASQYPYLGLFFLAIVDGPVVMILCGVAIKLGLVSLVPSLIALAIGDLTGDASWYWFGRRWGSPLTGRFGKYFGIRPENLKVAERILNRHVVTIFLATKITSGFGLNLAIIFTAGLMKVSFKKYMIVNAVGEIGRLFVFISLGYFFGNAYTAITGGLERVSFIVVSLLLLAAIFNLGKYMAKKMMPGL